MCGGGGLCTFFPSPLPGPRAAISLEVHFRGSLPLFSRVINKTHLLRVPPFGEPLPLGRAAPVAVAGGGGGGCGVGGCPPGMSPAE